ncbi:tryptophan-rich sensory protein [Fulvimarina endophytica]|uniref:Tryptophan-rich sensory protein n=1 Tax=Fulvimarina endophytica TaxID=2293836 RepID=A0A371X109_9HYPH|nr:TspO/MBR family protein [Fulvimarina endophytica]RFC62903.1 tryptophan-rich sensory protein [Fulvimarina endophytica]
MFTGSVMSFLAFLAIVLVVASSGAVFKPGPWYQRLEKPSWTPPNWAFPTVWSVLYLFIAIAGWRVYEADGLVALPFLVYGVQLVLNAAWSAFFFGARRADLAFGDVVLLWLTVVANIVLFLPIDLVAGLLLVPYLVWVTAAACLNYSVWQRNPGAFSGKAA